MQMVEGNFGDEQLDNEWAFEIDDGWGWEVELDANEASGPAMVKSPGSPTSNLRISLKPTVYKQASRSQESESSIISRVKSSSSFQELERAIGATLAIGLGEVDPSKKDEHVRMINGVISQKASIGKDLRLRSYNSLTRLRSDSAGSRGDITSSTQKSAFEAAAANMRTELKPFLDEPDSRALIIYHSTDITPFDVKVACKDFGSLYYFRSDFHSFGITLVCYSDLRCAVDAQRSIRQKLGRLADATSYFSVILHSSNGCDESKLCLYGVPSSKPETEIQAVFSRYGPLKSIQKSFRDAGVASTLVGAESNMTCDYTVEYFNMQDAKLAVSELNSSIHSVGGSSIDFVPFERRQEQARKEALSTLHSWRGRVEELEGYHTVSPSSRPHPHTHALPSEKVSDVNHRLPPPSPPKGGRPPTAAKTTRAVFDNAPSSRNQHTHTAGGAASQATPAVAGMPPTGVHGIPVQYHPGMPYGPAGMVPMGTPGIPGMYHMMPGAYYDPATGGVYGHMPPAGMIPLQMTGRPVQGQYGQMHYAPSPPAHQQQHQQQFATMNGYYVPAYGAPMPVPMSPAGMPLSPYGSYDNLQFAMDGDMSRSSSGGHLDQMHNDYDGSRSHGHGRRGGHRGQGQDGFGERRPPHHNGGHSRRSGARASSPADGTAKDEDFLLSPERLGSGSEKRTTVMIRNIPNKYSQSMLLEEINAKFDGLYDFFYLPIDFKNKCNVGYAFINFLDASNVGHFFDEFNGQRWRNFNSEKVCAITYARIQGKAAMIARFQNSSLLEKDDSYKPLLFVSKGPNKGEPEPFPSRGSSSSYHGY